jgi:inosose dehydratase
VDGAMKIALATGPVCWGVDFAQAETNPPWSEVLDGIAGAGYGRVELGPYGYLPADPARLRDELGARGLSVAGSFVFEPLHDPRRHALAVDAAGRVAALVAATGGRYLVVIDQVGAERAATAGRPAEAPRLDATGRRALRDGIAAVAAVAREHGLVPAVHPHAGSHVEFADEIAAAAEVAPLCVDTGHCCWAGVDPAALLREYGDRVACLHLKDVDARVRARGLGFWPAVAAGVFCPLGSGMVDLAAVVAAACCEVATVEQDRRPGAGDPVRDLIACRQTLERLGAVAPSPAGAS